MTMIIAWLILLEAFNPIIIQQIQPNAKYTKKINIADDGVDGEHLFHDDQDIHDRYLLDDDFDDLIYVMMMIIVMMMMMMVLNIFDI